MKSIVQIDTKFITPVRMTRSGLICEMALKNISMTTVEPLKMKLQSID